MKKFLLSLLISLTVFGFVNNGIGAVSRISPDEAKEAALQRINGNVINIGLEHEKDRLIYDVDVRTNRGAFEVIVDAADGTVVSVKKTIEE